MFALLTEDEYPKVMSVLDQDVRSRPAIEEPHALRVWFSEIANKVLNSKTPENGFCVTTKLASKAKMEQSDYIQSLWDRELLTVEIIRNSGVCGFYALPKEAVLSGNIRGTCMRPIGEDPSEVEHTMLDFYIINENPTSFAELYILGCHMTHDHFLQYIRNYKDLDNLRAYIDAMDEEKKALYLHALSDERVCIALPYEMFQDKRRPPDSETKDGTLLIFACPGYDTYISDLIDHMKHDLENNAQKTEQFLTKWKLVRLAKMYKLGWDAFKEQYAYFMKLIYDGYGK